MMMLMNIVTVASIDDEEKSEPTRGRKRKEKKTRARTTLYDILSLSLARFFSLAAAACRSFFLLLTFCMTKKNTTRVRLSSSMTIYVKMPTTATTIHTSALLKNDF